MNNFTALFQEELNNVEKRGESVLNHVKMTISVAVVSSAFLLGLLLLYIFTAFVTYSSAAGNWRSAGAETLFYIVYYLVIVGVMLVIVMNFTATARLYFYSVVLGILETVSLHAAKAVTFFIPDLIDAKLEQKLDELMSADAVKTFAAEKLASYAGAIAWIYLTVLFVISLPMGSVSNLLGIALSVIAFAFLLYAIYGWKRPPFWMDIIQQLSLYFAAGLILWNLFVIPLVNPAQYFGGWGLGGEPVGALVKLFWAIIFIVLVALLGLGIKFERSRETGQWEVGAKNVTLLFIAGVIILALFLFGGMAIQSLNSLSGTTTDNLAVNSALITNLIVLLVLVAIGFFIWKLIAANKSGVSGSTAIATSSSKVTSGSGNGWKILAVVFLVLLGLSMFTTVLSPLSNALGGSSVIGYSPASSPELGTASNGPYLKNESSSLQQGKAYKFSSGERVWIYDNGKFRVVANPEAFAKYYGCSGGGRPLDCAPIYEMPSGIKSTDKRLRAGAMIK